MLRGWPFHSSDRAARLTGRGHRYRSADVGAGADESRGGSRRPLYVRRTLSGLLHRGIASPGVMEHHIRGLRSLGAEEISYCKERKLATKITHVIAPTASGSAFLGGRSSYATSMPRSSCRGRRSTARRAQTRTSRAIASALLEPRAPHGGFSSIRFRRSHVEQPGSATFRRPRCFRGMLRLGYPGTRRTHPPPPPWPRGVASRPGWP